MVATDPEGLAQTINEGIAIRGIDALIDERLDLLCGPGTIRRINSPDITPLIKRLCDWARLVSHSVPKTGFVFWPAGSLPGSLTTQELLLIRRDLSHGSVTLVRDPDTCAVEDDPSGSRTHGIQILLQAAPSRQSCDIIVINVSHPDMGPVRRHPPRKRSHPPAAEESSIGST